MYQHRLAAWAAGPVLLRYRYHAPFCRTCYTLLLATALWFALLRRAAGAAAARIDL